VLHLQSPERRREREREPEGDERVYCCLATMRGKRKKNKLQLGYQISFQEAQEEVAAAVVWLQSRLEFEI